LTGEACSFPLGHLLEPVSVLRRVQQGASFGKSLELQGPAIARPAIMGWPYHFVDLTQDDILARRHALDKYGAIAQASAMAVIIGVAIYQWIFNRKHSSVRAARGPSYARVPTDATATGGPETSGNNRHGLEQGHGSAEEEVEMQSPAHFADALKDDEVRCTAKSQAG
jgi:hypothetical protein